MPSISLLTKYLINGMEIKMSNMKTEMFFRGYWRKNARDLSISFKILKKTTIAITPAMISKEEYCSRLVST